MAAALVIGGFAMTVHAAEPKPTADPALPITGQAVPELVGFDELLTSMIREHDLPGAALAISKDGRLIYARGVGFADREQRIAVQPDALFRIASISKPITAAAILQLVERGRLSLESRVFNVLAPNYALPETADERLKNVTVAQLLRHTGGWDRDASFDPMFRSPRIVEALHVSPPAKPEHVIRYMLNRRLDFAPGERYAYSNFGYCVLGRVIEQLTGQSYESYVQRQVLKPLGIIRMRIGCTLTEGRCDGEVIYYTDEKPAAAVVGPNLGQKVPHPYGAWCLETMDAHGGWVASAVDLVRFASAFDDPARCPILSSESVRTMFARPDGTAWLEKDGQPKPWYYAHGWMVRPVGSTGKFNAWHTGSLPGTSTLLVRRHDGLNWAVLFNTRNAVNGEPPAKAIDPLLHKMAEKVSHWPRHNAVIDQAH